MRDVICNASRGDRKAIAKLLTFIERDPFRASGVLKGLWAERPLSHVIGITGAGGVGKSSIIASLARYLSSENYLVGIIAIDPSSPFTGGALLGDRVRMKSLRDNVFIRSMSTSDEEAIPWKALIGVEVLEGVGFNYIIIETPGIGQFNVELRKAVDTLVVVFMPGLGDEIQALKAGLMEIGDIYVVNKADLTGADITISQIRFAVGGKEVNGWRPKIVKSVGLSISGIEELIKAIKERDEFLRARHEYMVGRRALRRELEIKLLTQTIYHKALTALLSSDKGLKELIRNVREGSIDTITASKEIMRKILSYEALQKLALKETREKYLVRKNK